MLMRARALTLSHTRCRRYDDLASKHVEQLRKLTKGIQVRIWGLEFRVEVWGQQLELTRCRTLGLRGTRRA